VSEREAGFETPFHSIGRLFPDESPPPVTVTPDTAILDALRIMVERRYSQLPVVAGSEVRGAITLGAFVASVHGATDDAGASRGYSRPALCERPCISGAERLIG
jgi:CBS domain-containing protein